MDFFVFTYVLFAKPFAIQFAYFLAVTACFFTAFEVFPLFLGFPNTIRKNVTDMLRFHVLRTAVLMVFAIALQITFAFFRLNKGFIGITGFPVAAQVLVIYLCSEFFIYMFHFFSHTYKVPLLSKTHAFHHSISSDMDWINSKKEHYLVLCLFVCVFSLFFFVVFRASKEARLIAASLYIFFTTFSHFRIPLSVRYLDKIFLFPKDHLRHHTKRGGPYGITLSLFDTLFGTRGE